MSWIESGILFTILLSCLRIFLLQSTNEFGRKSFLLEKVHLHNLYEHEIELTLFVKHVGSNVQWFILRDAPNSQWFENGKFLNGNTEDAANL